MSEVNIEHYKQWVETRGFDDLNTEKITLGKLISDTARRVQDLSGKDPVLLDKTVDELKELRLKLSMVIKQLQQKRENS